MTDVRAAARATLLTLLLACAGSIPSIPDTPGAILQKGDSYYDRGKFFQSSELYRAFVERYPGHDRSDFAQFRLAESLFNDQQYPLAGVEYQILIANYGYSEFVDDALFKMGVCFWEQSRKAERDQQETLDALSRLNQFLQTFPNSPLVPEAQEYIARINAKLADKDLRTARWYYRRKRPRAALVYCDKIISSYPDNEFWVGALYLKGCILLDRGEKNEAAQYFSQVMSYPEELRVKGMAERKLKEARE